MKMLFIPVEYKKELGKEFMKKILDKVSFEKIGLFTTVQFLKQMDQLKEFLEKNGKKVFVSRSKYRASEAGQVLGCDVGAATSIEDNVECFLYLGSGIFHQLNLAIRTDKKIIQANPLTEEISELKKEEIERYKKLRLDAIGKVRKAKKVGILVTTKPGQRQMNLAEKVKEKFEAEGKKVYLFEFETLQPEELYNFPDIEAWVNTACQRIAIDDIERFPKPVANAGDLILD